MVLKSISAIKVKDKKVLIRLDINSPVVNGKILDSPRLKESVNSLAYLLKNKAKVITNETIVFLVNGNNFILKIYWQGNFLLLLQNGTAGRSLRLNLVHPRIDNLIGDPSCPADPVGTSRVFCGILSAIFINC